MKSLVQPRNKPQERLLLLLFFLPSFLPKQKTLFSLLLLQNFSSSSSLNCPARSHHQKQKNSLFLFPLSIFLLLLHRSSNCKNAPSAKALRQSHSFPENATTQQQKKRGGKKEKKTRKKKGEEDTPTTRRTTREETRTQKKREEGRKE
jgi:hypothetical protein